MEIELVLKEPKDKPPCICMLFSDEWYAETENKHAINSNNTSLYILDFFIDSEDKLSMKFSNESGSNKMRYYITKYDKQELKAFYEKYKYAKLFSFCHLINDNGTHKIARSCNNNRLWVLKVIKVELDCYEDHVK